MAQVQDTRMSARDALWMAQEDDSQPMHGGLVLHYAGHVSREALIQLIAERLPIVPRLRQKMVFDPFGIAMPSWEDDPAFDLHNHVKELTLPAPADEHVLGEVVGRLHAERIDPRRPVWGITLLHGRPDGTTVVYFKMHHVAADAPALMQLLPLLHGPAAESLAEAGESAKSSPCPTARVNRAMQDRLTELASLGADLAARMRPDALVAQTSQMSALAGVGLSLLKPRPAMPWNGPLSSERRLAWIDVPFEPIRKLSKRLEGTINDVALTVIAGGLARYLRSHGYSIGGLELQDMVTVNVRRPEEVGGLGNRVTGVLAPLYVGIDDPLERFNAQRAAMDRVKDQNLATTFDELSQFSALLPPIVWQLATLPRPAMPRLPMTDRLQPTLLHLYSTNIVGPREHLYLDGHELLRWQSAGICMFNVGLFVVVQSYGNTFTFSVTVDPSKIQDEWTLVQHFPAALEELQHAAERGK